jgi:hypothetical protein
LQDAFVEFGVMFRIAVQVADADCGTHARQFFL